MLNTHFTLFKHYRYTTLIFYPEATRIIHINNLFNRFGYSGAITRGYCAFNALCEKNSHIHSLS